MGNTGPIIVYTLKTLDRNQGCWQAGCLQKVKPVLGGLCRACVAAGEGTRSQARPCCMMDILSGEGSGCPLRLLRSGELLKAHQDPSNQCGPRASESWTLRPWVPATAPPLCTRPLPPWCSHHPQSPLGHPAVQQEMREAKVCALPPAIPAPLGGFLYPQEKVGAAGRLGSSTGTLQSTAHLESELGSSPPPNGGWTRCQPWSPWGRGPFSWNISGFTCCHKQLGLP